MLFFPELPHPFRQPKAQGLQPVDAGMAASAERDQPLPLVHTGTPVMNVQDLRRSAALTTTPIPFEDTRALPAEIASGIGHFPGAGPAAGEPGVERAAAGTEKRTLKAAPARRRRLKSKLGAGSRAGATQG